MAITVTDAANRALIRKAIAYAEEQAGNDSDFVQILRATYFTSHPAIRRQLQVKGSGHRAENGVRGMSADPSHHIYEDPRFLKNARQLALKTTQNLRIIGGTKVPPKDFPDCVAVGSANGWGCTGTLIAPNVVLSAGHCSKVASARVFFGSDVTKLGKVIDVASATQHPDYRKKGVQNDLIVLVLDTAVKVKPRPIASTKAINAAADGRAVGFGNVDATGRFGYGIKRQVDIPIASSDCSGAVGGEADSVAYGCDVNLEIVAGKPMLAKDSCTGDSGGPFYIGSPEAGWQLAGATSRSTASAMSSCGDGGIYVRVDQYREWIEDTAKVKLP